MYLDFSLPSERRVVRVSVHVRPHMSLCVCVCSNCDDEPKVQTYCPNCRLPPERCTWLVSVCVSVFVCVCVQGTAVLQRYMGRSGGDTNGLQLWPRGLWELWLEQRGRGEKRRMRERQKRFNGGRGGRQLCKLRREEDTTRAQYKRRGVWCHPERGEGRGGRRMTTAVCFGHRVIGARSTYDRGLFSNELIQTPSTTST